MQTWSPFIPSKARGSSAPTRLCRTFREIAVRTEQWLTTSRGMGLVPAETTITDLNLFELASRHPMNVTVQRFNVGREAENGSDWEWTIGRASEWLTMRVQAKKLNDVGRGYDHLGSLAPSRPGKAIRQIDRLIDEAGTMPAIYTFFNGRPDPKIPLQWRTKCDVVTEIRGCTVAAAESVRAVVVSGSTPIVKVAPLSVPWSDLVCCGPGASPARRAQATIVGLGGRPGTIESTPPRYFDAIREGVHVVDIPSLADLDGVVLIEAEYDETTSRLTDEAAAELEELTFEDHP
jgi:hypothetical protein